MNTNGGDRPHRANANSPAHFPVCDNTNILVRTDRSPYASVPQCDRTKNGADGKRRKGGYSDNLRRSDDARNDTYAYKSTSHQHSGNVRMVIEGCRGL